MNERDQAQLFNEILERRVDVSENVPPEVQDTANFARTLQRTSIASPTGHREALRRRLLEEFPTRSRWGTMQLGFGLTARALAALALIASLLFSFTRLIQTVLPAPALATGIAQVTPTPASSLADFVSRAPFPVLVIDPQKAPFAVQRNETFQSENQGVFAVTQKYSSQQGDFTLHQYNITGDPIVPAGSSEISVRGVTGYWLSTNTGENTLTWNESGTSVSLIASLSQADLLALSEALVAYDQALTLDQIAAQVTFTVFVPDPARLSFPLNFIYAELSDNGQNGSTVMQTYGSDTGKLLITQSALPNGMTSAEPPMKSTGEVSLRGKTGYWLTLNTGETALYWEEAFSAVTLSGLSEDQLLEAAESLQPLTPALTIEEAARKVTFPILVLEDANQPFPVTWQSAKIYNDNDGTVLVQTFLRDGVEIRLQQRWLVGDQLALPEVDKATVSVRGVDGYMIGRFQLKTLIWLENGVDVSLSGEMSEEDILTLADALTYATSVVTPGPVDCTEIYPGLPGCTPSPVALEGQIAFSDERLNLVGAPSLADLRTGNLYNLGTMAGRMIGWSPSGQYFLIRDIRLGVNVYNTTLGHRVFQADSPGQIDPFWLSEGAVNAWKPDSLSLGITDWLALPTEGGGLDAYAFPTGERETLLPDGAFPDAPVQLVLSTNGWIAWLSTLDSQAIQSGQNQILYSAPLGNPNRPGEIALPGSVPDRSYILLDWAPGTNTVLLGTAPSKDEITGGVSLVALDVLNGNLTDLNTSMLPTQEAYDWNPVQPGEMVLAEGSGNPITSIRHLATLNVLTGEKTEWITSPDAAGQPPLEFAVFEPKWSPDGTKFAYAALQISGEPNPNAEPESLLAGRAIWVQDMSTDPPSNMEVTAPQAGESGAWIDGWPRWTEDGTLLFTRQFDGYTEVYALDWLSGSKKLLLKAQFDPACAFFGCHWDQYLQFNPRSAPAVEPTPTPDPSGEPGAVLGKLSYPSEYVAAQNVVAINVATGQWFETVTQANQAEYGISGLPPGVYHVISYYRDEGTGEISGYAGGYTQAVLCGLKAECTDHTLLPVTVQPGETVTDVNPTDWYADDRAFPAYPGFSRANRYFAAQTQINLAPLLTGTEQIEVYQFAMESDADPAPYKLRATITDPGQIADLIAALDQNETINGTSGCVAEFELRFTVPDTANPVVFGYLCGGGPAGLSRGALSGDFVIDGEVPVSQAFQDLLAPVIDPLRKSPTP